MKTLLLVWALFVSGLSQAAETWKDPNGVSWTFVAGRTTFERAQTRCAEAGFALPSTDDLLEALDAGLADPQRNPVFGDQIKSFDWMWTATPFFTPVYYIVSRWGDSTPVLANERHFVVCAISIALN